MTMVILPKVKLKVGKTDGLSLSTSSPSFFFSWWFRWNLKLIKIMVYRHISTLSTYIQPDTYPSEKYEFVSWDDDIPIWMEGHNPFMFQSTNQTSSIMKPTIPQLCRVGSLPRSRDPALRATRGKMVRWDKTVMALAWQVESVLKEDHSRDRK